MMVYQHHERYSGKGGYPVGICGDEIHQLAH